MSRTIETAIKASEYSRTAFEGTLDTPNKRTIASKSFREGAVWADRNPVQAVWHRFPDEEPPLHKLLICATINGKYALLRRCLVPFSLNEKCWDDKRYSDSNIEFWMEIPEKPTF